MAGAKRNRERTRIAELEREVEVLRHRYELFERNCRCIAQSEMTTEYLYLPLGEDYYQI